MNVGNSKRRLALAAPVLSSLFLAGQALAADSIRGQVLGGGAPIAKSTVPLWAASAALSTRCGGEGITSSTAWPSRSAHRRSARRRRTKYDFSSDETGRASSVRICKSSSA